MPSSLPFGTAHLELISFLLQDMSLFLQEMCISPRVQMGFKMLKGSRFNLLNIPLATERLSEI